VQEIALKAPLSQRRTRFGVNAGGLYAWPDRVNRSLQRLANGVHHFPLSRAGNTQRHHAGHVARVAIKYSVGAGAPQLLRHAAIPLAAAGACMLLMAVAGVLRQESLDSLPDGGKARAFHLSHALLLVGLMALLLLVSALLQSRFGSAGVMLAAAAVALVEVHAAAASLTQLTAQGQLPVVEAGWGLVLLVLVASVAKTVLAFFSGGARYGWRVAAGLLVAAVGMALTMLLLTHNR
jgi:uncharacterized membrane protein (DUF4010 family)